MLLDLPTLPDRSGFSSMSSPREHRSATRVGTVALDSPVSRARRVRDRAGLVCSSEGGAEWVTCLSCARRREPWGPALAGNYGIPRGPGCPPGSILQPARQPPPALALCWPSGPWSRLSSLVMRAALGGRAGWVVRGVGDTPVSVLRRNVSAGEAGRKPPAVPAPSTTRTIM